MEEDIGSMQLPTDEELATTDETAIPMSLSAQPAHESLGTLVMIPAEGEDALVTTDTTAVKKRKKIIVRKKKRPARVQVDPDTVKSERPVQTGVIYNVWYNKWSGGDREDSHLNQTAAKGRCNLAKDTGYTRADDEPGSFICLFFARGVCPKGQDCEFLHRSPTTFDIYSGNVDCFGRDKHSDYRDDMGGVGSFMRQNRTLYIGRVHPTDDVEEIVARHFQEWGTIERTRVLPQRGVAFVTYTTEALAQFAKEAMAHQSLDNNEVLNVRWATQDPNPQAQKREVRKIEEQAAEAIRRALPAAFVKEIEGRDPEAKRRRKEQGNFGLEGYEASDEVWFQSEKQAMTLQGNLQQASLQAAQQPLMIEEANVPLQEETTEKSGGILTASCIAAFDALQEKKRAWAQKEAKFAAKPKTPTGPLVDYDSDGDDEW